MHRLPPLHALRVFEAVTRLRSFTAAAAELHLTQSAVSHQISNLEEFFGFPLLDRRKRTPAPNTAGEALFAGAQAALEVIARTVAQMRDTNQNQIRIKTYPSIGFLWLMPRLCDFYLVHPGIKVSLTTVSTESPIARWDEYDYTIEYGSSEDCGHNAELLHEESLTPLCSPALCPGGSGSMKPEDLASMTMIHPTGDCSDWPRWWKAARMTPRDLGRVQKFDTDYMALSAAKRGMGVTISDPLFAASDLADGLLLAPCDLLIKTGKGYYLASAPDTQPSVPMTLLRDWLFSTMRESQGMGHC
ncbi:Glycine cleavage system transcriptional activator [Paraburkholderia nemoris]|uniref:LysR substrate-binding domain-containing protein n=1 Tax=Paraburkholderia nemoris TaxID=2793076 RepID=UPI000FFBDF34|nr:MULTISPECIES: LysR substrate-binding domain-containing protein [Paraburkholderia]MBK3782607.1 LysR family transcriptional regulator [Paraburkholderia aspalathi]CAE6699997.1 Glycine cleavage system transcriptional activator [Paraburkholderia nemoris]CAE6735018.1 Glycine cleavage system transcriptional activator [Paraburkholderia nemoris]CAE6802750.1 Glycine cleavage system transcriptional activator [Paraburkholderia nemoris]CAE6882927.1 Glycine cleavage system transcriptional activator [Para